MKKIFFTLLFIIGLAYAAFPYYHVYQLDQALQANDKEAIAILVDLDAVRQNTKRDLAIDSDKAVGYSDDIISQFLREGAQVIQRTAVDNLMDVDWFTGRLRDGGSPSDPFPPLQDRITYAFFDGPASFLIRIGELGHNPVHMGLEFNNYQWHVTKVYRD